MYIFLTRGEFCDIEVCFPSIDGVVSVHVFREFMLGGCGSFFRSSLFDNCGGEINLKTVTRIVEELNLKFLGIVEIVFLLVKMIVGVNLIPESRSWKEIGKEINGDDCRSMLNVRKLSFTRHGEKKWERITLEDLKQMLN